MAVPTAEQNVYLTNLEELASMLHKAQINMRKCPKARLTEGYVKARLKSVEDYWGRFKEAHHALNKCTPREQKGVLPYFLKEEYYSCEELYLCLQGDLTDLLSQLKGSHSKSSAEASNTSTGSVDDNSSFARLPRITLPTFSGRYEDWPTYQDLFTALVHNTNLNDVQKLHYLKTSVSGEAEMLLRHIQITENNYSKAWELLKNRFGNKKMIVTSLLKRLFFQKKITVQSANQIKSLVDTTMECLNSLNNMNISTDSWDPVIIFLVSQKLDTESLKDWEEHAQGKNGNEFSKWHEMKEFLEFKFRTLELIAPLPTSSREKQQSQKSYHVTTMQQEDRVYESTHAKIRPQPSCTYCKAGHHIFTCKDFVKLPVDQRRDFVKKRHLCYNCLVPSHSVYTCKQRTSCRICRRKHHSLLHEFRPINQEEVEHTTQTNSQPEQNITTAHFAKEQSGHSVLLATAQVEIKSRDGNTHLLRALIDQGSEASFVSARVVEVLGLKKTHINGVVSGVGEENRVPIKYFVDLSVISRLNRHETIPVKAYVLKRISTILPSKQITINWPQLQTLQLADPVYYKPGNIDMLLGADIFGKIIEEGLVKISNGLVAQKTSLGWILSGQNENKVISNQHNVITLHITRMVAEDNDMLRRFWEIDAESYKKRKLLTKEEERCEEIYTNTTVRDKSGRYTVHLPLKQSIGETVELCGDTKQQAIARFEQLERKLQRNQKLRLEYTKVINEYKEMGHMKRTEEQEGKHAIYLPHHAVIREDKDTSKVRVVYDGSAKGTHGHSLNTCMMVGPVLQPDLRSLVITWRKHKICVVGDIIKMYRMILMTEEHTNLQRIVWRDTPEKRLESYNLQTVTFGTAAAPYLAVRTLHQLADDEANAFPDTAPVIKKSFYMDDLMSGNDDVVTTKKMCEEIKTILNRGGFKMQKWSSNSEDILEYLQGENITKEEKEIKIDTVIRILGLTWDRKDDTFKITVNLPILRFPITKRSILSDVARLFDPFGWLSPVILTAKSMIQKLWLCNLSWDAEVPLNIKNEWMQFRRELTHLQNIRIPRWFQTTAKNCNNIQIHGFADASIQGYAAVTYLRIVEDDVVHVALISSRTKVAPLKQLSIPKLELCAAVLLTELIKDLIVILEIPKNKIFAWTDSMVVLSWLQSQPSRWQTFVANRVADIVTVLDNDQWRHVESCSNPADIATRTLQANDLVNQEVWWNGPKWLRQTNINFDRCDIPQTELEIKKSFQTTLERENIIWERFSTLSKMKRVLAYCRRFLRSERSEKFLTVKEMERVLEDCIKYYQNLVYYGEIEDLKKYARVKKRSSLITLSPFLDSKGLLRIGGRLQNASIAETTKHPVIIPANQHITKLIINEAHIRTLHGGIQLMMAYVRTKYWVIGLKSAVKKCIHQCKTCVINTAKITTQFMGQLPAARVNQNRAFINSGVDYAGPVMIRTSKGRGHNAIKGYICLFICMATRAIHLEAVTDLTSQAFIAAFRRFVARRGRCLNLWSDNGTNFTGAARELKQMFKEGKANGALEIAELLANDGTTWHFIPPRMPNCGGLWEAGVQSAKKHLARVNKDTKLTYEELTTLLAQIEACLNSRPLCQLDNTTDSPLTPGHFLVGESLIGVPDVNYENRKISLLTRWQLIQKMTQDFWRRWQTDYLHTLQQRYKWQKQVSSPAVGDIVVIREEDMPPTKWLLGRIKYLHKGPDNLARVAIVQCKGDHELKRPISKLIPLPKE